MAAAANERELLSGADFFLSILPPGEAEALAQHLAPALKALDRKPVYVDCNAVSPQTAIRIGEIIAPTGADFVDAGIIGGPPRPGYSPTIYASGPTAGQTAVLRDWGIDWRVIDGPIGAASALKMSYAGITKGTTAIASAMLLGAARFGCARGADRRADRKPARNARPLSRKHPADVRQGLSLGRRDGGNFRLSRKEPAVARHLRRNRPPLRLSRRGRSRKGTRPRQRRPHPRPRPQQRFNSLAPLAGRGLG